MKVNLVLLKAGGNNKAFSLPSSVTIVGRRQDCDLCVPLTVVSRRHCALNMDGGELSIRDLGSSNGTFVNGERVDEADLVPGDKVSIGPLDFIAQIDGVPVEIIADKLADEQAKDHVDSDEDVASTCLLEPKQDMSNTKILNIFDEEPF
jgi:pSer/pThr/pTyr-binding forkhead associated (FHA) protein